MAMTRGARALNTKVNLPESAGEVTKLKNGLLKTGRGLIVPPSVMQGDDTRTGGLAKLTEAEKASFGIKDAPPPAPAPEPPPVKGRSRRKARRQEQEVQEAPDTVKVRLVFDGVGSVPVEYAHVHFGDQCAVLGLTGQSYVPKPTTVLDGEMQGLLRFEERPGEEYAYMGHRFTDSSGVDNIVLIGVSPEER